MDTPTAQEPAPVQENQIRVELQVNQGGQQQLRRGRGRPRRIPTAQEPAPVQENLIQVELQVNEGGQQQLRRGRCRPRRIPTAPVVEESYVKRVCYLEQIDTFSFLHEL